jgi:uncharacterized SAM-binding protein YcdF (DUF218 family)
MLLRYAGSLLFPLPVCLFLLFAGLYLLWRTSRHRAGRWLVTLGSLLLLLLSLGPVADALIAPYERDMRAIHTANDLPNEWREVKHIVVLWGGYYPDPEVPISSRPSHASLARFVEGVRLHKMLPHTRLLVTLGDIEGGKERIADMRQLAEAFGLSEEACTFVAGPRNTSEEAVAVAERLKGERCLLVTSASHLPRALHLFARNGIDAFPAPTQYEVLRAEYPLLDAMPSSGNLRRSERACYETLAWIAARFR